MKITRFLRMFGKVNDVRTYKDNGVPRTTYKVG